MTAEEIMAAMQDAKEAYEREKRETEEQLQRAKAKIAKLERRLEVLHEHHLQKANQLLAAFMGVPGREIQPAPHVGVVRRRRGEREEMVLSVVQGIASPDVAAKEIEEVWNRRYPNDPISDSTIRSILDRLESKKKIHISVKGGGVGSGIPTRYSPGPPPE
jgi:hypothetical protein